MGLDSAKTMKCLGLRRFLGVMMLPLGLEHWTAMPISGRALPEFKVVSQAWNIRTRGSAGGYVQFLEEALLSRAGNLALSWDWKVTRFPKTRPNFPFEKSDDDFAIRVGVLISDGEEQIPVPGEFKKVLMERKQRVAFVVFYCAISKELMKGALKPSCGTSPYHDHVVNCLLPSQGDWLTNVVFPIKDAIDSLKIPEARRKKLKVIGFWVFADSDNTESDSMGELRSISVKTGPE